MTNLVIATRNQGKLREIIALLKDAPVNVVGLDQYPAAPDVVEDGDTFLANAEKKALTLAAFTGSLTLADDSGLVVPALGGAPGVHSARYAGPMATDVDNNRKLLSQIATIAVDQRQAEFHCVMVLALPGRILARFNGQLSGVLLSSVRGDEGFGYDPLFLVREYGQTLAELPLEIKNRISHRGTALKQFLSYLTDTLPTLS
jgi:XTP/dITP diphosphohydrolase